MSNNVLQKIATDDFADGGLLNATQSKKFFSTVVDESLLKNNVRTIFLSSPIQEINKMNIGERVAQPKPEGVALDRSSHVGITTSKLEISTKSIIVPWSLTYESLEDNIEKAGFEDSVLRDISAQLANDLEELFIEGDTASADTYLAQMDGWLKLMLDGGHEATTDTLTLEKKAFSKVLTTLPTKYRRNRRNLRFFVNPDQEQDYRDELASRNTDYGDKSLQGNDNVKVYSVQIVPVPAIPKGYLILTNYKNLIMAVYRKIRLEKDKDIYAGEKQFAIHLRVGCQIENTDAIAFSKEIKDVV